MEKGGGKGFSLPTKEPKSSLKSCNWSKGKGGNMANGGKSPMPKEPPPIELKIEPGITPAECQTHDGLRGCTNLTRSPGPDGSTVSRSNYQTSCVSNMYKASVLKPFDKGLQYAKTGARYTNPQSVRRVLEALRKYGVSDGEICLIANVFPETADEAFALVPSLKVRGRSLVRYLLFAARAGGQVCRMQIPLSEGNGDGDGNALTDGALQKQGSLAMLVPASVSGLLSDCAILLPNGLLFFLKNWHK
ncbi:unnamed protein product [Dovyalis caffra]|uniref:Uncharacterized protein n=1 Tax=Dovyalis caffra TaxID=77055 RepID=A0AAV1QNQ8_9ROSI|nr:unnamed protein product [Dovyalis caffra]